MITGSGRFSARICNWWAQGSACRYRFFDKVSELAGVKLGKSFMHLRALFKNLEVYVASRCSFPQLGIKQVMRVARVK